MKFSGIIYTIRLVYKSTVSVNIFIVSAIFSPYTATPENNLPLLNYEGGNDPMATHHYLDFC